MTLLRHGWCQRLLYLPKVSIEGERAKAQRGDGKGSGSQAKGSKGGGRGEVTNAPAARRRLLPLRVEVLVALLGPLSAPGG